ncbi:hypothetical protein [Salmonella enterica]|nr:hypothetical protein [Salmonella enterica]
MLERGPGGDRAGGLDGLSRALRLSGLQQETAGDTGQEITTYAGNGTAG